MATDPELCEAALAFVEQSDNCKPDICKPTHYGRRGYGYMFTFDRSIHRTVVLEWNPEVDEKGLIHGDNWNSCVIEDFIGGVAVANGISKNEQEVGRVAGLIKTWLPDIS